METSINYPNICLLWVAGATEIGKSSFKKCSNSCNNMIVEVVIQFNTTELEILIIL